MTEKKYKIKEGIKSIELYTKRDAAEMCNISERNIFNFINNKKISVYYVSSRKASLVDPNEILALLEIQKRLKDIS